MEEVGRAVTRHRCVVLFPKVADAQLRTVYQRSGLIPGRIRRLKLEHPAMAVHDRTRPSTPTPADGT